MATTNHLFNTIETSMTKRLGQRCTMKVLNELGVAGSQANNPHRLHNKGTDNRLPNIDTPTRGPGRPGS